MKESSITEMKTNYSYCNMISNSHYLPSKIKKLVLFIEEVKLWWGLSPLTAILHGYCDFISQIHTERESYR